MTQDIPINILIVDDHPANRLAMREILTNLDLNIIEAESGRQALKSVLENDFALILMDVVMPGMDGFETTRIIRSRQKSQHTPVVFITASDPMELTSKMAYLSGGIDFITHPIIPEILRAKVSAFVELFRHQQTIITQHHSILEAHQTLEKQRSEIKRLYHDSITDLPNRNSLEEALGKTIEKAGEKHFTFLLIGLNSFQSVNDTLGFHYGDLFLGEVAKALKKSCNQAYTLFYIGGSKFGILLDIGSAEKEAEVEAGYIAAFLEKPLSIRDIDIVAAATFGCAVYPAHGKSAGMLLRRADVAMQYALKKGFVLEFYSPSMDQDSEKHLALTGELKTALDNDQFFLVYQPKVGLQTGKILGVEALIRWNHHGREIIPPCDFIPIAEQTGLITALTTTVIRKTLQQIRTWSEKGLPSSASVNLSARDLMDPTLAGRIQAYVDETQVSPFSLTLEITEGMIVSDPVRARKNIAKLTDCGVRFSIDDFGTGYSSLSYLKELNVNEVKVDRSFVSDMLTNSNSASIVCAIIDLAHHMTLAVVAEGVETKETLDLLRGLSCDEVQGYYISRPLPEEEIARWLEKPSFSIPGLET